MKKYIIVNLVTIFYCIGNISAQDNDLCLYENIKSFYNLIGFHIDKNSKQELESIINVKDLVKDINNKEISFYKFDSYKNDFPSNIIIIEKDSIDLYDIFAINAIISRIVDISNRYPDVSKNKKDIAWIRNVLALHLSATKNVISEAWVVEKKMGRVKYHIKYDTLESSKK